MPQGGNHAENSGKTQLRFLTCGSVDDGKSTLIGRLLYDSGCLFEDQIISLHRESLKSGADKGLDFSLLMDGLLAEREQGITIDVAYRYFETPKRKFIVADTPGHEQYTRNMATGASNSDSAVVLVDARNGILPQTTRHTYIAMLLGIRHIALAVNKMDLCGWSGEIYDAIMRDYRDLIKKLEGVANEVSVEYIPLSARMGDNVFARSKKTPWYVGPTLIEYLEGVEPSSDEARPFRMPVQWVNRPNLDFRGYCGTITDGEIHVGDEIIVLPSGQKNLVTSLISSGEDKKSASKGDAVTISLEREIDISRGDVLADAGDPPLMSDQFRVALVWMSESKLIPEREYLLRTASRIVPAFVTSLRSRMNIETLNSEAAKTLAINEIGICNIQTASQIIFEPYKASRELGGFILIDRVSNETVGAGMIQYALRRATNVVWQSFEVDKNARAGIKGQSPCALWFTGLSGSGKSTIANLLEKKLFSMNKHTYVLDGDNVRHGLNRDLGFTEEDRVENVRRVSEVAKLMVDAGLIVLVTFISPFRKDRDLARSMFDEGEFVEVFVDTPLEVCESRDPKGLYKKARIGAIPNFTGVNSPYERPEKPEIVLRGTPLPICEAEVEKILKFLSGRRSL
jgi:bifunctional enzyme CysN/CysC